MSGDDATRRVNPEGACEAGGADGSARNHNKPPPPAAGGEPQAPQPVLAPARTRPKLLSRGEAVAAITTGVVLGLAGIGAWWAFQPAVNALAASTCRTVIPALNPEGASFTIGPPQAGAFDNSVRITYVAHLSNGRVRARTVDCHFEAADAQGERVHLTAVATERGPLNDANFYFLRRFYLEAGDGPPPDPASSQATAPRN